jgi:hypothetical protein
MPLPAGFSPVEQEASKLPPGFTPASEEKPISDDEHSIGGFSGNVLSSGANLLGNVGSALIHAPTTLRGLRDVAAGTLEKPLRAAGAYGPNAQPRPEEEKANAVGRFYKSRYGGLPEIGETLYHDPMGALADASVLAGGTGAALRGGAGLADVANAGRLAGGLRTASKVASTVGDVANSVITAPVRAVGGAVKAVAPTIARSALSLPSRASGKAALDEISGVRPGTMAENANAKIGDLGNERDRILAASTARPSLTPARTIADEAISKAQAGNSVPSDLFPMQEHLVTPHPGFGGDVTPTDEIAETQTPMNFLDIRNRFGKDYTKFEHAKPLTNEALGVGNRIYGGLTDELHSAVPESLPLDTRMSNLIPVRNAAETLAKRPGAVDRLMNRLSARTGAMAVPLVGYGMGGAPGAAAAVTLQELLSDPTARMIAARGLNSTGKGITSPAFRRAVPSLAVAGANQ